MVWIRLRVFSKGLHVGWGFGVQYHNVRGGGPVKSGAYQEVLRSLRELPSEGTKESSLGSPDFSSP